MVVDSKCSKCSKCSSPNNILLCISSDTQGNWKCLLCNEYNFYLKPRKKVKRCKIYKKEEEEDEDTLKGECVVCFERNINSVITVCGHLAYCGLCAARMNKCPICRARYNPLKDVLKVYKVIA
jgi:hypothetical protein